MQLDMVGYLQNVPEQCKKKFNISEAIEGLESHLMRLLVTSEAESGSQVRFQIRNLANAGHDGFVDLLLVLDTLRVRLFLGRCLTIFEELLLTLAFLLFTHPVLICRNTVQDLLVSSSDVDCGGSRNDVAMIDTS